MLVGAAAEQPRRAGAATRNRLRGHRGGDTGELEPVPADEEPVEPEELVRRVVVRRGALDVVRRTVDDVLRLLVGALVVAAPASRAETLSSFVCC
jgi:hypothetical protein